MLFKIKNHLNFTSQMVLLVLQENPKKVLFKLTDGFQIYETNLSIQDISVLLYNYSSQHCLLSGQEPHPE